MKSKYKVSLQYTGKKTKKIIKEAIELYNNNASFEDNGWKGPFEGSFKSAYIKNNIVVKFGPSDQLYSEFHRWQKFRGSNIRKHLSRVYGCNDDMLIQKKVNAPNGKCYCDEAKSLSAKVNLKIDWASNHAHEDHGVVFFDTDDGWNDN